MRFGKAEKSLRNTRKGARAPSWRGRASCNLASTERVLEVLVAVGMLARDSDRYALSTRFREAVGRGPGGWPNFRKLWAHTPDFLRSGARLHAIDGSGAERAQAYLGAVSGLGTLFEDAAASLSEQLPARREILDVGAGSGVWSLSMLAKSSEARVTALDFEAVLPNFRARAERLGLLDRTQVVAANFHDFTLEPRSTAWCWPMCSASVESHREALVRRCTSCVPGGDMVIVDVLDGSGQDLAHADLALAMRPGGRAHPSAFLHGRTSSERDAVRRSSSTFGRGRKLGAWVATR